MICENKKHKAGFTLIELLIVMMIIIIAAYALRPTFANAILASRQKVTARRLVSLLVSARVESLSRGRLVRVVYSDQERAFWAEVQPDPGISKSEFAPLILLGRSHLRLPDEIAVIKFISAGQEISQIGWSEIYFYPDGRTDGATIVLSDVIGREFVIALAAATGKVNFGG